ncbi:MAG TPA: AAA family ATPase, partial [Candidatus Omnitrophota bacterium]|nr:AAA family ATPase [Candidatus Omnitrophota bacterium]
MYLDFFKLKENPFNITSDPDFLYLSETHREALNHLMYGINERKGFIEITGEIGSGKTTICRAMLNSLPQVTKTSVIFNSSLPEIQLLEAILLDFGLTPERRSKVMFFKALNSFLLEQLALNNNVILVIDEAQNLKNTALETIRMLSNLETEKEKLMQIILIGQPELRDKLNSPDLRQLKQRISVSFHLNALSPDEVKEYIAHRLRIAGSGYNIFFEDAALDLVAGYSKGIPRVINTICDKALLMGYACNTNRLTSE